MLRHTCGIARPIGHAEMRHDEAQARMTFEYARDPRRTIVRVFVPRNVTDVREHEAFALRDAREHRIEARIVDRQTLHVFVYFQSDAAVVKRRIEVARGIRIVQVHGRQRHAVAVEVARGLREPRIEIARHPGFMRVRTKHEALDAGRAQRRGHGSRLRGMVDRPVRPLGKPAPNRRVQTRRVQMDVDVNQSEEAGGPVDRAPHM